jgi:aspartyl-tRNA(Asn)/glutamyl-tRNA(Gln) amidotransferase subunit B
LQPARVVRRRAPLRFLRAASAGTAAAAEQAGAGANAAAEAASADYETVCGIETHVQLNTRTKAFCACELSFGAEPNKHTCPVCLGHPGTLPVLNDAVVDAAVKLGFALGGNIARVSKFDRKQYFYADLPKGYQISQYDEPIVEGGVLRVSIAGPKGSNSVEHREFTIERAHMEEDSGKLNHQSPSGDGRLKGSTHSLADYNRAGTPLLEVVSGPDMRSGRDAAEYAAELQRLVRFLGIGDGNMAEGSLRCDVNVSVRKFGAEAFGTKVEVKNLNSFSAMEKAVAYERERQIALLEAGRGDEIVQETRLWEEGSQVTVTMRKKEGLADYRYFPEPDLPPVELTDARMERCCEAMGELPWERRARYEALGLPVDDVLLLADAKATGDYFDAVLAEGADAKAAANWIMGDIMGYMKVEKKAIDELALTPPVLAELLTLIAEGTVSGKIAKELLPELLEKGGSPRALVDERGLGMVSDEGAIEKLIDEVIAANPNQLEQYRSGKTKMQGFFMGQVMKKSGGKVDPALTTRLLVPKLKGDA